MRGDAAWKFEIILALVLLGIGFLLGPPTVYWLGGLLAGDYAGERGLWGLVLTLWGDAARGRLAAWVVLLAPYLVIQLLRLALALARSPRDVTGLTNSEKYQ